MTDMLPGFVLHDSTDFTTSTELVSAIIETARNDVTCRGTACRQ